jgi:tyrosinase
MVQLVTWATALFVGLAAAQSYPPDVVDKLAEASLPKLKAWLEKNPQGSCTYETAIKRREWLVLPYPNRHRDAI